MSPGLRLRRSFEIPYALGLEIAAKNGYPANLMHPSPFTDHPEHRLIYRGESGEFPVVVTGIEAELLSDRVGPCTHNPIGMSPGTQPEPKHGPKGGRSNNAATL
jgi:hypothetical protein